MWSGSGGGSFDQRVDKLFFSCVVRRFSFGSSGGLDFGTAIDVCLPYHRLCGAVHDCLDLLGSAPLDLTENLARVVHPSQDVAGELFRSGRTHLALERYKKIVELLNYTDNFKDADLKTKAKDAKRVCELNKAACYLRLKEHAEAKKA